jgi:hypothetical protein
MSKALIAVLYALAFLPSHQGGAQEVSIASRQRELIIGELSSGDPEQIASVQLRLQHERAGTISALMSLVASPAPDWEGKELKHKAIGLLGEYRAVQACGVLLREAEFHPPDVLLSHHPLFRYPAAVALTKIGEPGIPEILVSEMNRILGDKRLKIYAYILWCHYGQNEKEVGLFRIKHQLGHVRKTQEGFTERFGRNDSMLKRRENNLERLLEIYQRITPYDPKDWPKP